MRKIFAPLLAVLFVSAVARPASADALFTRPTDTIMVPGHTNIGTTMTIEAVLRLSANSGYPDHSSSIFMEQVSGATGKVLRIAPNNGGLDGLAFSQTGVGHMTSNSPVSTEQWHHMAFVHEGTSERLYLDGTLVGERAVVSEVLDSQASMMSVGAFLETASDPDPWYPSFFGLLDWVRVSSSARYSGSTFAVPWSVPAADSASVLLYDFDRPFTTTVQDLSSNHWDGAVGAGYFSDPTSPIFVAVPLPASAWAVLWLLGGFGAVGLIRRGLQAVSPA